MNPGAIPRMTRCTGLAQFPPVAGTVGAPTRLAQRKIHPSNGAECPPPIGRRPGAQQARYQRPASCRKAAPFTRGPWGHQLCDRSGGGAGPGHSPSFSPAKRRPATADHGHRPTAQPGFPLGGGDSGRRQPCGLPAVPHLACRLQPQWLRRASIARSCILLDWPGLGIRVRGLPEYSRSHIGEAAPASSGAESPRLTQRVECVVVRRSDKLHRWPGCRFSRVDDWQPPPAQQLLQGAAGVSE